MEIIKKYLPVFAGSMLIFLLGAFVGVRYFAPALTQHHYTQDIIKEQPTIVRGETKTETKTQIAYVPKETIIEKYIDAGSGKEISKAGLEQTDLQADIGKHDFSVRLNGKDIQFMQADDEKFMFDKNKIALNQTSSITFDATVAPTVIDETKWLSAGIGYGTNGIAYTIDIPIHKEQNLDAWYYKDKETQAGGVKVRF